MFCKWYKVQLVWRMEWFFKLCLSGRILCTSIEGLVLRSSRQVLHPVSVSCVMERSSGVKSRIDHCRMLCLWPLPVRVFMWLVYLCFWSVTILIVRVIECPGWSYKRCSRHAVVLLIEKYMQILAIWNKSRATVIWEIGQSLREKQH